jgi:hypothetical protein
MCYSQEVKGNKILVEVRNIPDNRNFYLVNANLSVLFDGDTKYTYEEMKNFLGKDTVQLLKLDISYSLGAKGKMTVIDGKEYFVLEDTINNDFFHPYLSGTSFISGTSLIICKYLLKDLFDGTKRIEIFFYKDSDKSYYVTYLYLIENGEKICTIRNLLEKKMLPRKIRKLLKKIPYDDSQKLTKGVNR